MSKEKTITIELNAIERTIMHDALKDYLMFSSYKDMEMYKITTCLDIYKKLGFKGEDNLKFKVIASLLNDNWGDAGKLIESRGKNNE